MLCIGFFLANMCIGFLLALVSLLSCGFAVPSQVAKMASHGLFPFLAIGTPFAAVWASSWPCVPPCRALRMSELFEWSFNMGDAGDGCRLVAMQAHS